MSDYILLDAIDLYSEKNTFLPIIRRIDTIIQIEAICDRIKENYKRDVATGNTPFVRQELPEGSVCYFIPHGITKTTGYLYCKDSFNSIMIKLLANNSLLKFNKDSL